MTCEGKQFYDVNKKYCIYCGRENIDVKRNTLMQNLFIIVARGYSEKIFNNYEIQCIVEEKGFYTFLFVQSLSPSINFDFNVIEKFLEV